MSYPKLSEKKCNNCTQFIFMKRKRDEVKEFCGRKCASIFLKSNKETRTCLTCNVEFKTIPSHDYHYCSTNCSNKSRSKIHNRICERCGDEFELCNIAYEKRGGGRFCSSECATRKYEFDNNFFKEINAEEKAYWLGFLFADGNIYKAQMTLKLKQTDEQHLLKFKQSLSSEHPIHRGKNSSHSNSYYSSFFIGSKELCGDLIKLGITPKKSFTIKFPQIPEELYSHFIRGYFDGDGNIYINTKKNNHKVWSIFSGSKDFILTIKSIIESKLNITIGLHKQGNGYKIYGSNKKSVKSFCDYIYQDASIYLDRKRNNFLL